MTDHPDPGPRRDWGNDHDHGPEHDWAADYTPSPDHGRHASPAGGPSEDLRLLSEAEERGMHFNGYPPYDMLPLHELCYEGFCRYKTEAENRADLEGWYARATLTAEVDPEAGL